MGYTVDEMDNLEKSGFFIGKDYEWWKRIHTVSCSFMIEMKKHQVKFGFFRISDFFIFFVFAT